MHNMNRWASFKLKNDNYQFRDKTISVAITQGICYFIQLISEKTIYIKKQSSLILPIESEFQLHFLMDIKVGSGNIL